MTLPSLIIISERKNLDVKGMICCFVVHIFCFVLWYDLRRFPLFLHYKLYNHIILKSKPIIIIPCKAGGIQWNLWCSLSHDAMGHLIFFCSFVVRIFLPSEWLIGFPLLVWGRGINKCVSFSNFVMKSGDTIGLFRLLQLLNCIFFYI